MQEEKKDSNKDEKRDNDIREDKGKKNKDKNDKEDKDREENREEEKHRDERIEQIGQVLLDKNKEKQNGLFIWKKIDTEDFISTYSNSFTTKMYSMDKNKTEDVFQVFVKNQDIIDKNVDIIIELNVTQKNMNK